jgi:hypothetical protein
VLCLKASDAEDLASVFTRFVRANLPEKLPVSLCEEMPLFEMILNDLVYILRCGIGIL